MFLQKECHWGQQRGCGKRDFQEIIRKTLLVAGALPSVQFCWELLCGRTAIAIATRCLWLVFAEAFELNHKAVFVISWDRGCRDRLANAKEKRATFAAHCTHLAPKTIICLSSRQAAAVPDTWIVIRCGFYIFVDIVISPAKFLLQEMSEARGTTPNAERCWCQQREGRSLYPGGRRGAVCFFIAFGSNSSILLEGCSVRILVFLWYYCRSRDVFGKGNLNAWCTTLNADCS